MEAKPQVGQSLFFLDSSELDPTAISELKRLRLTSEDELEVICSDGKGISVRFWREGQGDQDAFLPENEWARWTYVPLMTGPNPSGASRQTTHAPRRFPDEIR